jgi:phage shock protein PspC (stress-responsive transcriptional regulator)
MRTVITISLNGNAYQLEAPGYEALRAYLQVAEQRLAGNPDQMEILADLEQAIADKCARYLGPHKNVVTSEEVAVVLQEMGPVDGGAGEAGSPPSHGSAYRVGGACGADARGTAGPAFGGGGDGAEGVAGAGFGAAGAAGTAGLGSGGGGDGAEGLAGAGFGAAGAGTAGSASGPGVGADAAGGIGGAGPGTAGADGTNPSGPPPKRLYQIREGAMISGVCKGLAAYLNIDVSIVRILFVLLAILTGGAWILVYIVMMFVVPYAQTSEQHAAAHGWPFNAEELVARAKAHYAEFRSSEKWRRQQWREQQRMWKYQHKQWKAQQRAWKRWGSAQGAPPPPPPPQWGSGQAPPNASYTAQVLHGVVNPIAEILGAVLFITFLILLVSLVTRHRVFGWWLPHDIPVWLGVVILIVLYRAIAAPLHQARYAAYYGAPFGQGWIALWGALVWLVLLAVLCWFAWQHWSDVQEFLQDAADTWRRLMEQRSTQPIDPAHAAVYFLAWAPPCALAGWGKLQSHGQIDRPDVLGDAADRDVIDSGLGDAAHSLE